MISTESSSTRKTSAGRLATASLVGTTLEWYDFTIYNTLAALIFNRLFFPSFDPLTGTLLAFSTYAVGYISSTSLPSTISPGMPYALARSAKSEIAACFAAGVE